MGYANTPSIKILLTDFEVKEDPKEGSKGGSKRGSKKVYGAKKETMLLTVT